MTRAGRLPPAALAGAVIGAVIGVPWLLPSFGPTVALQAASPELEASRPWNVLAGHAVGITAGFLAVHANGPQSGAARRRLRPAP